MELSGLLGKYPVNRSLTAFEREFQLKQKQRLSIVPHYQLSVIKMNSCYLETVDKWYGWKGVVTTIAAIALILIDGFLGWGGVQWILEGLGVFPSLLEPTVLLANGIAMTLLCLLFSFGLIWLLRKESFAYTHYPIRFNREKRMVYVFRTDGTILSISWDELFFTLANVGPWNKWEVQGHVLHSDNNTVLETFPLSYVGLVRARDIVSTAKQGAPDDPVRAHWEFIRRYMEDGPEEISKQVQFCMPIDIGRENFRLCFERVFANFAGAPTLLYLAMFPFCLLIGTFRLLAVYSSKVPTWTEEVEASCTVENDDPFAIRGAANGERVAVYPEAALAADVRFCSS